MSFTGPSIGIFVSLACRTVDSFSCYRFCRKNPIIRQNKSSPHSTHKHLQSLSISSIDITKSIEQNQDGKVDKTQVSLPSISHSQSLLCPASVPVRLKDRWTQSKRTLTGDTVGGPRRAPPEPGAFRVGDNCGARQTCAT